MWSLRSSLFISLMSKLTSSFPWLLLTSTCFNFKLLLRISSIRLPLADTALTLALAGASRGGGGGGGGGGRFIIVFLEMSSWKSVSSLLIYFWAIWTFCWRSLLYSDSACLLACFKTVYSMIIPMTSLSARSSLVSLRESNIYCHSGGTFSLLKVPSLRLNEMEVFFLNEII